MKSLELIAHVGDWKDVYRNVNTGIAFVHDGITGVRHSCHSNIDVSGSISGMKARGYWGKKDRCITCNGNTYNIDTLVIQNDLDRIASEACMCPACKERRLKNGLNK